MKKFALALFLLPFSIFAYCEKCNCEDFSSIFECQMEGTKLITQARKALKNKDYKTAIDLMEKALNTFYPTGRMKTQHFRAGMKCAILL